VGEETRTRPAATETRENTLRHVDCWSARMQPFVAFGLAALGVASLLFARLSAARFARDWNEHRAATVEARRLGPFRDASSLARPSVPSLGGPSYLLAAAVALTLLILVADRRDTDVDRSDGLEASSGERLLVGAASLRDLGHVVRMSGSITGLGFVREGDTLRIFVEGVHARDPIAMLGRVMADIDRARVDDGPGRTELVIHLVSGRDPRWSAEAINDCVVLRFARRR
jgi:hypothetical protein